MSMAAERPLALAPEAWTEALRARLAPSCLEAHLSCVAMRAPALWLIGFGADGSGPLWSCETTLDGHSFSHAGGSEPEERRAENRSPAPPTRPARLWTLALGPPLRLGSYPGSHWRQATFFERIPSEALALWASDPGSEWEAIALGSGLAGEPHAVLSAAILALGSGAGSTSATGRARRI